MDEIDRLLSRVKKAAHGLMPLPVYRRIHDTAAGCAGGTIVEIGTFRGAATVAMALGARRSGQDFTIVTADLLRPGIGAEGDCPEEKAAELAATFALFGVADSIRFVHGDTAQLVAAADPRGISLLLLDGGGRIETDLALLWERLDPACIVIIDDIDGRIHASRGWRSALVDQKHRISKLLADRFVEAKLLIPDGSTGSTGWYRKGAAELQAAEILKLALPAYHALIKVRLPLSEVGPLRATLRALARRAPWLARAWRAIRPAALWADAPRPSARRTIR